MDCVQIVNFLLMIISYCQCNCSYFKQCLNCNKQLGFSLENWGGFSDVTKQAQKVIFSRKTKKLLRSSLLFINIQLNNSMFQKHLDLTLDIKLRFSERVKHFTQKR